MNDWLIFVHEVTKKWIKDVLKYTKQNCRREHFAAGFVM